MRCFALLLLFSTSAIAQRYQPALDQAFDRLYSSDFTGAQVSLDAYIASHPADPVAYSAKAAGYLFGELERLGILEGDFFQDNRGIADKKKNHPDARIHDLFYDAVNHAEKLSAAALAKDPNDTNALFGLCLAKGVLTDYMALVEKHQFQSMSVNKEGYRDAKRLIQVAPDFYDAYLATGFTEYLVGSVPVIFRWMVRFDDVRGDKQQGIQTLDLVARNGHYLRPFAKILLAAAYLRGKRYDETRAILKELTVAYPQNALLKREFDRLASRM